jgi:hypothetical protein
LAQSPLIQPTGNMTFVDDTYYDPYAGRWLPTNFLVAPNASPENPPAPSGGYLPSFISTGITKVPEAARNFVYDNSVSAASYLSHIYFLPFLASSVLAAGAYVGMGRYTTSRWRLLPTLATLAIPSFIGIARWGWQVNALKNCKNRGFEGVYREAFVEDIYHFQFYGLFGSVGGKRVVPKSVETISDGFYIFVVDENSNFIYREMSDRGAGGELYVRHSQLNDGNCAKTAGMMMVSGKLIVLTNKSGHYGPGTDTLKDAVSILIWNGYNKEAGYKIETYDFRCVDLKQVMINNATLAQKVK